MITYRSYTDHYNEFLYVIDVIKLELKLLNIQFDKIEIEECIYDTNEKIDNNWLKK